MEPANSCHYCSKSQSYKPVFEYHNSTIQMWTVDQRRTWRSEECSNEETACRPMQKPSDVWANYRQGWWVLSDFTKLKPGRITHYRMRPIPATGVLMRRYRESSHGYFKVGAQALLLRGSLQFDSITSCQGFIIQVVEISITKCNHKFLEGTALLARYLALPRLYGIFARRQGDA